MRGRDTVLPPICIYQKNKTQFKKVYTGRKSSSPLFCLHGVADVCLMFKTLLSELRPLRAKSFSFLCAEFGSAIVCGVRAFSNFLLPRLPERTL